jgi:TRAP-type C4-dicarboxylate transport system substrate-binding protein
MEYVSMTDRRQVLALALAAPFVLRSGVARASTTLKLSHQFPGGSADTGDFRDRLSRLFAAEVGRRSGGEIAIDVHANSSLIKVGTQFSAMRKGALDLSLVPLPYAGGEMPEANIALMPGLVSTYAQGLAWKHHPVGRMLSELLAAKGIVILTWIWQSGGLASRSRPVIAPDDARGMKIRGGSREMDLVLQAAGAAVLSIPSNEIYAAMHTGACDAALTSSTSLISFRLAEVSKALTSGAGASYWFMLEPLMMSKVVFDALPVRQRDILVSVGAEMELFGRVGAEADDDEVAKIYRAAGSNVQPLEASSIERWRSLARATAWKDFAGRSAASAELLRLAEDIAA